jgi:hypothetical protein
MSIIQFLSRINLFLSQNAPTQLIQWNDGLNEDQINDLVKDIPCILSVELRELYKWHNGSGYNPICHDYYLNSLEDAVDTNMIFYAFPNSWKPSFFEFASNEIQDYLFVDCNINDSPVWYRYWENSGVEMFWSSTTKMFQTIADAYETGAYYLDDNYFVTDGKKLLDVMWRNDPDIINSIIEQLKIVNEERLNDIPFGYESIKRFIWQDISEIFDRIRSDTLTDLESVEALQEFSSIFLDECESKVA